MGAGAHPVDRSGAWPPIANRAVELTLNHPASLIADYSRHYSHPPTLQGFHDQVKLSFPYRLQRQ